MSRVVAVVDTGNGQEAVVFTSQASFESWAEKHPEFDECVQGVMPLVSAAHATARAIRSES